MIFCFLLLLIPLAVSWRLRLGMTRQILIAAFRMSLQLFLAGLFLKYLFQLNLVWVNILWLLVMLSVAMGSVTRNSELRFRYFGWPVMTALTISLVSVVLYFNTFVIQIDRIFEARYFIVLGGMLLGNALKGVIVGVNHFFHSLKIQENHYLHLLAMGATRMEALHPFLESSLRMTFKPTVASMTTIGIVALPGMMSGQILGGSQPMLAIKYQITIMVAIFTAITLSILLTLLFTIPVTINGFGMVNKEKVYLDLQN